MLSSSVRYFLLTILIVIPYNTSFEWPFLQTCTLEDEKCHIEQVNNVYKLLANGIEGLDLPSLDPMNLANISANGNSNENIKFQLTMKDTRFYKFSRSKCLSIKGFTKNASKATRIAVKTLSPHILLKTRCHIKGKILIFNVEGDIDTMVNIKNLTSIMTFFMKPYTKDGHIYLKCEELRPKLVIGSLSISLKNSTLFNGDPAFIDSFANTINANWPIFSDEIEPLLNAAVAKVIKDFANKILATMPYDKFFKEE